MKLEVEQIAYPLVYQEKAAFKDTGVLTDPTTRSLVVGLLGEYAAPRGAATRVFTRLGDTFEGIVPGLQGDGSR